jgi:hypothetical protein
VVPVHRAGQPEDEPRDLLADAGDQGGDAVVAAHVGRGSPLLGELGGGSVQEPSAVQAAATALARASAPSAFQASK